MAIGYTTAINGKLNSSAVQVLYSGTPEGAADAVIITVDNTNMKISAKLNDNVLPEKIEYAIIKEASGVLTSLDYQFICGSKFLNGIIYEETDNLGKVLNRYYLTRKAVHYEGGLEKSFVFIGAEEDKKLPVLTVSDTRDYQFEIKDLSDDEEYVKFEDFVKLDNCVEILENILRVEDKTDAFGQIIVDESGHTQKHSRVIDTLIDNVRLATESANTAANIANSAVQAATTAQADINNLEQTVEAHDARLDLLENALDYDPATKELQVIKELQTKVEEGGNIKEEVKTEIKTEVLAEAKSYTDEHVDNYVKSEEIQTYIQAEVAKALSEKPEGGEQPVIQVAVTEIVNNNIVQELGQDPETVTVKEAVEATVTEVVNRIILDGGDL